MFTGKYFSPSHSPFIIHPLPGCPLSTYYAPITFNRHKLTFQNLGKRALFSLNCLISSLTLGFQIGIVTYWLTVSFVAQQTSQANVLVSCCHCNKVPLTQWLKTTQIYSSYSSGGHKSKSSFTVLRSGCTQGCILGKLQGGIHSLAFFSFYQLPTFLGLRLHHSDLCFCPHIFSDSLASFFPFKDPCDYIEPTQILQDNLPHLKSSDYGLQSNLQNTFTALPIVFDGIPREIDWP